MSVVVVPRLLVTVSIVLRCEVFEGRLEIVVHQSRLEFGRGDSGRRTDDEDRDQTLAYPPGIHELNDMIRKVQDLAVALGLDLKLMRFDGHFRKLNPKPTTLQRGSLSHSQPRS